MEPEERRGKTGGRCCTALCFAARGAREEKMCDSWQYHSSLEVRTSCSCVGGENAKEGQDAGLGRGGKQQCGRRDHAYHMHHAQRVDADETCPINMRRPSKRIVRIAGWPHAARNTADRLQLIAALLLVREGRR